MGGRTEHKTDCAFRVLVEEILDPPLHEATLKCPGCDQPFSAPLHEHPADCPLRVLVEGALKVGSEFFAQRARPPVDMGYYVLDDDNNALHVPSGGPADTIAWGYWFEQNRARRVVAQENIGPYRVSTVFLGLDHDFRHGICNAGPNPHPILFETMVFESSAGELQRALDMQERCSTWNEAQAQHEQVCARIRRTIAG